MTKLLETADERLDRQRSMVHHYGVNVLELQMSHIVSSAFRIDRGLPRQLS
jgi:hypothetical protein